MHPFDNLGGNTFQKRVGEPLDAALHGRKSVVLIGMKRVGINAFVRQYLKNKKRIHLENEPIQEKPLHILIDLNNLFERSLYAFWILTLKTLLDAVHENIPDSEIREKCETLFAQSIQLRDTFFTMHSVQRLITALTQNGHTVTLFFLRFDRLQPVITNEFYSNLQGLKDGVPLLAYVITSYRPLDELVPEVFTPSSVHGFFQEQYVPPLDTLEQTNFLQKLYQTYKIPYTTNTAQEIEQLCGGHVQYLHLAVLRLKNSPELLAQSTKIRSALQMDENIQFLTEEIFKSLTLSEQKYLKNLPDTSEAPSKYLLKSGIVQNGSVPFSDLFLMGISQKQKKTHSHDFSKKEQLFFDTLFAQIGNLVERNTIIETVWQEESELGVSDWAVDRLAARVRRKLVSQRSQYKIQTVVSRGYKLAAIENISDAHE